MEFDTKFRRFISGQKSKPVSILPCATGLFNHRQTAMYRGRRSALGTTKLAMYRQNDWPIIIQLQDCNGPKKNKDHIRIASQHFPFSTSKLFFSIFSLDR